MLLLDDPLSALDVRTEEAVTLRLREALQGTTTLIVAHRPSTVALPTEWRCSSMDASPRSAPTPSCWNAARSTARS